MCEIAIETDENELTLYNLLVSMNKNNNYSIQVKEHLDSLISLLEKSLSKDYKYIGYVIDDSNLIRIIKLEKDVAHNY